MPSKLQDVDSPSLDDWFTSPVTPQDAASVPLALIGSELCRPFYIIRPSFVIFDDIIVRTINNLVDFRSGIRPKTRNWSNNFSHYNSKQLGSDWCKKKIFVVNTVRIRFILLKLQENKNSCSWPVHDSQNHDSSWQLTGIL